MTPQIEKFWDLYEQEGIAEAVAYAKEQTNGSPEAMAEATPYLIAEGKKRDIDMMAFLEALDEEEQKQHAAGTDNGAGELSSDSSDEGDQPQDEDESASARDADGEDREEQ